MPPKAATSRGVAVAGVAEHPLKRQRRESRGLVARSRVAAGAGAALLASACVVSRPRDLLRWASGTREFRQVLPVARINASSPDALLRFFREHHGKTPVVFQGAMEAWAARDWTLARLAELCPDAQLPVYRYDPSSVSWAGLVDGGQKLLSEYLQQDFGRGEQANVLYGLEMTLRTECPRLLEDLPISRFFADDMLARFYPANSWPTLIAGPRGTRSGLHRDTHDLPFWMAMFLGRKRLRIFAPEDPALEPYFLSERNGFEFDAFRPDEWSYPGLTSASVYEHMLLPGELLYIPSGAPHGAENLEDAVAVSANFLDPRGLDLHKTRTCSLPLWSESKLCWFHVADFEKQRASEVEALAEDRTYFQVAGFDGPRAWCDDFLPRLRSKAAKHPEYGRRIAIVERYCASKV